MLSCFQIKFDNFRIRQNLDVTGFELTDEEMKKIATIGKSRGKYILRIVCQKNDFEGIGTSEEKTLDSSFLCPKLFICPYSVKKEKR